MSTVTPPRYRQHAVEKRWNPWAALRARPDLEFGLVELPPVTGGGLYVPQNGWAAILVDRRLGRRERAAVLAHELVHAELVGHSPPSPADLPVHPLYEQREERAVDRVVADRLLPLSELQAFCERLHGVGVEVGVHEVTEEFDVADEVAAAQLRTLVRRLEESASRAAYAYADARIASDLPCDCGSCNDGGG